MFRQKIISFLFSIFIFIIFSNNPSFAMDLESNSDDEITVPIPPKHNKRPRILIDGKDLDQIPTIIEGDHPIKKRFNNLLRAGGITDQTAAFVFYKYNPNVFFTSLDEKFFLRRISPLTRLFQVVGVGISGAEPWALGPLGMYLAKRILNPWLPISSEYSYGIVFTMIGLFTFPCAYQGWEIGGQFGNMVYDWNGFMPSTNKASKRPHIQPEAYPYISRIFSAFNACIRTTIPCLLFLEAESRVDPEYGYGLTVPLAFSQFTRHYNYSMTGWERLNNSQRNKASTEIALLTTILVDSLRKTQKYVNSRQSPQFIHALYQSLKEVIRQLESNRDKKNEFHNTMLKAYECSEDNFKDYYDGLPQGVTRNMTFKRLKKSFYTNDVVASVSEYIWGELKEEEFEGDLEELKRQMRPKLKDLINHNVLPIRPFTDKNRSKLIHAFDALALQEIKTIKLTYAYKKKQDLCSKLRKGLKIFFSLEWGSIENHDKLLFDHISDYLNQATTVIDTPQRQKIQKHVKRLIVNTFAESLKKVIQEEIKKIRKESETLEFEETVKSFFENLPEIILNITPQPTSGLSKSIANIIKINPTPGEQDENRADTLIKMALTPLNNPDRNQPLIDTIYEYIQKFSGKVALDRDVEVPVQDTTISLFSLLLQKSPKTDGKQARHELQKAHQAAQDARKVYNSATELPNIVRDSPPKHKSPKRRERNSTPPRPTPVDEAAFEKLTMAINNVASYPIERWAAILDAIKGLSPQPFMKGTLENLSHYAQGAAHSGRILVSHWAVNEILTKYLGVGELIAFPTSLAVGICDTIFRAAQEWDLQQKTFSSVRGFGSKANDHWGWRWVTSTVSTVSALFQTLPTIAILFNLLEDTPPYIKIIVAAVTSPSDYTSFFHFLKEKWDGIIRSGSSLFLPCCGTLEQEIAWINGHLEEAIKLIPQFDKETTRIIYNDSQGGLNWKPPEKLKQE